MLATAMLAMGLMGSFGAQASVIIGGTRVIFNGNEREQTIKLRNAGDAPALTQTWVDNGDIKATPASLDVPFTVTPPVARIDPGKGQTLRILYSGEPLAQDKESVYWLNVVEVPPKPTGDLAQLNTMQLAFRSRIKLFYRPAHLKGSAADAPSQVTWSVKRTGKSIALEARNPTPYYVSIAGLEVASGAKALKNETGGMVGPGESAEFALQGDGAPVAGAKVHYSAVSDWGGVIDGDAVLSTAD